MSVANGGGHSAVGFLRGLQETSPSWSCLERCQQAMAAQGADEDNLSSHDEATSANLLSVKDAVVPLAPASPASPASGSQRGSYLRHKHKSLLISPTAKEECERCSCCTKEEYLIILDVFASMDRRGEESVRRGDFLWALSAHGASIEFQRIIRRSRLSAYFKSTAREISVEEFVRRIFPALTAPDLLKMQRWMSLRKAQKLVMNAGFHCSEPQIEQLFALLEEDSSGVVNANELVNSQILTRVEMMIVLPPSGDLQLSSRQFNELVVPVLAEKYGSSASTQENGPSEHFEEDLKDKFHVAQDSSRFLVVAAEEAQTEARWDAIEDCTTQSQNKRQMELEAIFLAVEASKPAIAQPLPPGTVASLISRLKASSPSAQSCKSDVDVSPVNALEHSSVVSAF